MLIFESSIFLLFVCLLAAVLLTSILYWRKNNKAINKKLKALLFCLRCGALFLLFALFLNIIFSQQISQKQKAVVVNLIDNSKSVVLNNDSVQIKEYFKNYSKNYFEELSKNFNSKVITFGEENNTINNTSDFSDINFNENNTDISSALLYTNRLFDKNHIDACVLYTDGIYTKGFNPINLTSEITYPIYVVGFGDTTSIKDYSISNIRYNKEVYLGKKCVFEVNIKATDYLHKNLRLQIYDNNNLVYTKGNILVDKFLYVNTLNVVLDALTPGKHYFKFVLESDEKDLLSNNNEKTVIVNILENKKNITIFANEVSPDIGAIKQLYENNNDYTINSVNVNKFNINDIKNIDIAILYGMPYDSKSKLLFEKIIQNNIPYLNIVSTSTNIELLNEVLKDISIQSYTDNYEEAYPSYNSNFSTFKTTEEDIKVFNDFSPLIAPFGIYYIPENSDIMFYQKINNINTTKPLILTTKDYNSRNVHIFGEGIWRWAIKNFIYADNHNAFNNIIDNLISYLSLSEIFQKFQIDIKDEFFEDEEIIVKAILYNDNFELINNQDVVFELINNENKSEKNYHFSKEDNIYSLNIGKLPEGFYTWTAKSQDNSKNGTFIVSSANPEYINLQANHVMLKNIAEQSGGMFLLFKDVDNLNSILEKEIKDTNKTYLFTKNVNLRNILPVILIISILLFTEWILRRRAGIY
ncbi:MAG: hypothetical protein ACOX4D_08580 [Bacteroidales bacterium]